MTRLALLLVAYALTPPLVRCAANSLTLSGHERFVTAVLFTLDCERVVSRGEDDTVRVWDATTGKELRSIPADGKGVACLAVGPYGKRVAAGGWAKVARVFDVDTDKALLELKSHMETVTAVASHPRGGFAAGRRPSFHRTGDRVCFAIPAAAGQVIASVGKDGKDRETLTTGGINNWPAYSPDGTSIAFCSSRVGEFDLYVKCPEVNRLQRVGGSIRLPAWYFR